MSKRNVVSSFNQRNGRITNVPLKDLSGPECQTVEFNLPPGTEPILTPVDIRRNEDVIELTDRNSGFIVFINNSDKLGPTTLSLVGDEVGETWNVSFLGNLNNLSIVNGTGGGAIFFAQITDQPPVPTAFSASVNADDTIVGFAGLLTSSHLEIAVVGTNITEMNPGAAIYNASIVNTYVLDKGKSPSNK